MGEQQAQTNGAERPPSAIGDPAVRAALLFIALAAGVAIAFLALARLRDAPPIKGLDRPEIVVLSSAPHNDPGMIYTVEIHRGGEAIFQGGPEVLLPGRHVYLPPSEKVTGLFEAIDASRFRWLKPHSRLWIGGSSKSTLCLRQGKVEKCVDATGEVSLGGDGAPGEFNEIRSRVQNTAEITRWLRADEQTIDVMREQGIDPRSAGGRRLMLQAAEWMSPQTVQTLVDAGFPVDAADSRPGFNEAITPAEIAAGKGRHDVLRVLLAAGALKGKPAALRQAVVVAAAQSCRLEAVKVLGDAGVRIDPRATTSEAFMCNSSPRDDVAVAKLLLAQGLSPNARDEDGHTPLFHAPSPDLLALLLSRGADPNARDKSGAAPLLCAQDQATALALIKAGARIDAPSAPCDRGGPATIDELAAAKVWPQVQARLAQDRAR